MVPHKALASIPSKNWDVVGRDGRREEEGSSRAGEQGRRMSRLEAESAEGFSDPGVLHFSEGYL